MHHWNVQKIDDKDYSSIFDTFGKHAHIILYTHLDEIPFRPLNWNFGGHFNEITDTTLVDFNQSLKITRSRTRTNFFGHSNIATPKNQKTLTQEFTVVKKTSVVQTSATSSTNEGFKSTSISKGTVGESTSMTSPPSMELPPSMEPSPSVVQSPITDLVV